mmetsp:Transcript_12958/g.27397  ORF Transcript_12958/g.27397 Transcript_12958/m.27397 type:complete len:576 (-) Transcript_12958:78-1805(-)
MRKSSSSLGGGVRWVKIFVVGLFIVFAASFVFSWYYTHQASGIQEQRKSKPTITLVGEKKGEERRRAREAGFKEEKAALLEEPTEEASQPLTSGGNTEQPTAHSRPHRDRSRSNPSTEIQGVPSQPRSEHHSETSQRSRSTTHTHDSAHSRPATHTPSRVHPWSRVHPPTEPHTTHHAAADTRKRERHVQNPPARVHTRHSDEVEPQKEKVEPESEKLSEEEELRQIDAVEVDDSGAGGRPTSLAEASERRATLPVCGAMPVSLMPNFTYQHGTRKNAERRLPGKSGYVGVSGLYNKPPHSRARTENGPRQTRIESSKKPQIRPGEAALIACLENLATCGEEARAAAHALKPVKQALLAASLGVKERYKTCAVVGNSGGMLLREYGPHIDAHDAVVRINVLENSKYSANLGTAAHYRVLSYKMGKDVCCIMPKEKHPPDNEHLTYLVWFPANREELASLIRKRYKNPVKVFSNDFLSSAIAAFKGMRHELVRMGFGPFEDWEFITSGMHAVLAFVRSCDSLDTYGFTTDVGAKTPYWFTGRNVAPRSGRSQHAWDHERMILRLLHAAGLLNICTS